MVFPPAVQLKTVVPLGFVSTNFPPGTAVVAEGRLTGQSPAPWPPLATLSGARPRLIVSELPEVLENSDGGSLQQMTAPVAVSGRLADDGEEDRYELLVKPGTRLRFDVTASRLGSPLDGVLSLLSPAGVLASSDDRPGTSDPGLDFAVPKNVSSVIVSLKDLNGRGGPDFIYRIAVIQIGAAGFHAQRAGQRGRTADGRRGHRSRACGSRGLRRSDQTLSERRAGRGEADRRRNHSRWSQ